MISPYGRKVFGILLFGFVATLTVRLKTLFWVSFVRRADGPDFIKFEETAAVDCCFSVGYLSEYSNCLANRASDIPMG